jgi:hypothetical protein
MKFVFNEVQRPLYEAKVGNVYRSLVESRAALDLVYVVVAITPDKPDGYNPGSVCCLLIDKDGDIRDVAVFYADLFSNRTPIAFVEGIEELTFNMHKYEELP